MMRVLRKQLRYTIPFLTTVLFFLLTPTLVGRATPKLNQTAKSSPDRTLPNIVLCMGDDHGWEETGYNGLKTGTGGLRDLIRSIALSEPFHNN